MSIKRNVLLNPGPATTTDSVKLAQVVPDICPREKEFGQVMEFVSKELTNIVANEEEYTTILIGGSGTAGVESMISSVVAQGHLLIINNGAYGKRMAEIAQAYNINYIEFISSPIEPIDLEKLEEIIVANKDKLTHVAMIHHETTTGLLNPIGMVGALCKKYKLELLVDAMSSFGGIPIDMKAMNISFMVSSSNKCIQGMAGLVFVICNRKSLENIKSNKRRNLYLSLYDQYEYFKKNYQMRFTPPVQTLYALKQAIIEFKEEGMENRYNRYSDCWKTLIDGLERLGLEYLVEKENQSRLITTIIDPNYDKYDFDHMHDYLYEKGFTIYPGKISFKNTFRIANIGQIYPSDIAEFINVMEEYLNTIK